MKPMNVVLLLLLVLVMVSKVNQVLYTSLNRMLDQIVNITKLHYLPVNTCTRHDHGLCYH
jgi:hypothetical protein